MKKLFFAACMIFSISLFAADSTKVDTAKNVVDSIVSTTSTPVEVIKEVDNSVWQQLMSNLLGENLDLVGYISCFIFSCIGLFLRWYWTSRKGIKNNPDSPNTFSWGYWLNNNILPKLVSVMATFLIIFLSLRFSFEIIGLLPSMFLSLLIGLCFDVISDKLKNLKLPVKNENA